MYFLTSLLGSKFFGHPILNLNENLTAAATKLFKTLLDHQSANI